MLSIMKPVVAMSLLFTLVGSANAQTKVPAPVQRDPGDLKPQKALDNPALAEGLKWLASKQAEDGSWTLGSNKIEGTGLALLAFLGAGQTHRGGIAAGNPYTKNVDRALKFLLTKQTREGALDKDDLIANAIAAAAIGEAYGLTSDPGVRGPARRAVNYIIDSQHDKGGWGKTSRGEATMTSIAWNRESGRATFWLAVTTTTLEYGRL
jgi:squalene cyclase